jgi:hypothetical protein
MNLFGKHHGWSDVAVFEDVNAGKALESFLTGKGFQARTHDDKLFRYFLFLRPPRPTVRVQVHRRDIKVVEHRLTADPPGSLEPALHCPSCSSLRVSYPQMTRKFILPTIILHLGIIFRVIEHECYCEHCHNIWNLPTAEAQPARKPAIHFPFSAMR